MDIQKKSLSFKFKFLRSTLYTHKSSRIGHKTTTTMMTIMMMMMKSEEEKQPVHGRGGARRRAQEAAACSSSYLCYAARSQRAPAFHRTPPNLTEGAFQRRSSSRSTGCRVVDVVCCCYVVCVCARARLSVCVCACCAVFSLSQRARPEENSTAARPFFRCALFSFSPIPFWYSRPVNRISFSNYCNVIAPVNRGERFTRAGRNKMPRWMDVVIYGVCY